MAETAVAHSDNSSKWFTLLTHPQVHPLFQHPLAVELTQDAGGRDAEGGVGGRASTTGDVAEEVVPQLPQQCWAAQQGDRSTGLDAGSVEAMG